MESLAQSESTPQGHLPDTLGTVKKGMAHHKELKGSYNTIIIKVEGTNRPYGVPQSQRILPPGLFIKKFDRIRDFLAGSLELTYVQREVVLRLLRFSSRYEEVYPKAATVCSEPGCSKRTFWRVMRKLQDIGLVQVSNRYVIREHAQISNLYRFHKLLILLVRYLAEHGQQFYQKWLKPYLAMSGRDFWGVFARSVDLYSLPSP